MLHGAFSGAWSFDLFRPVFEERAGTAMRPT